VKSAEPDDGRPPAGYAPPRQRDPVAIQKTRRLAHGATIDAQRERTIGWRAGVLGRWLLSAARRENGAILPDDFTLLQITPRLGFGGVEQLTVDLASAVAAAGRRSLVASRGGPLEAALLAGGAEFFRLPVHAKDPITVARNAARLVGLIRREGVSLVHVHSRAPAFSALWAARSLGVPVVATYHGIYPARSALKRRYNAVMTRGDRVIANSTFTRDRVIAEHFLPEGQVAVVPEGIDTQVFDPAAVGADRMSALRAAWGLANGGKSRRVILIAARLTSLKGQQIVIEALGSMKGREDAVLILAGGAGSIRSVRAIEAAAAVAGLADQVRFVGPCDDMPAAYALADLVAAPSTIAESFGRTVVEAGAMERPVLASALGGPMESVVEGVTGWLVPPGDVDAWTLAVRTALDQPAEVLASMGIAARERVKRHYSLVAMREATFAVYAQVLEART
jgi:glycosyltransferase involved in cell wall biosynthesis